MTRVEGPTPNGGAYSVGTYLDLATFQEVDESVATGIAIVEYDADGTFLFETIGVIDRLDPAQFSGERLGEDE
jgi:hypothetical protein